MKPAMAVALAGLVKGLGLHVMYLPDDLDNLAEEVVRAANALEGTRPELPPFAIMVDDRRDQDTSDPLCHRVSTGTAIGYRRGPRLAVVNGSHTVTQSFSSAFANVAVGYDYPGAASTRPQAISDFAQAAVDALCAHYPEVTRFLDQSAASECLSAALVTLSDAYEALAQGAQPWNVYWFRHVRHGLSILFSEISQCSSADADQVLSAYTFAAFGLPRPANGQTYAKGRRFEDALVEHWGSREQILLSLGHLRSHPSVAEEGKGEPHALESLLFKDFDQQVASKDNLLLAWGSTTHPCGSVRWLDAFRCLLEAQFFAPRQGFSDLLGVSVSCGVEASIGGGVSEDVIVFTPDEGLQSLTSETIELSVDADFADFVGDVSVSEARVHVSKPAEWQGDLVLNNGRLIFKGRILLPLVSRKRMPTKPLTLSVEVPPGDLLASKIGRPTSGPVYPIVRDAVGAWVFESSGDVYRPAKYYGYETLAEAIDDYGLEREIDDKGVGSVAKVLLWGGVVAPTINFDVVRSDQDAVSVCRTEPDLVRSGDDTVQVGNLSIRWVEREAKEFFQSPLMAAARKGAISSAEPDVKTRATLRGRLEDYIGGHVSSSDFVRALGHMAMLEDSEQVPGEMEPAVGGSVLVPVGDAARFSDDVNFKLSGWLRDAAEVTRFRAAFEGLGIKDSVSASQGSWWVSRTSWERLFGSSELEEYLASYVALIECASSGTPSDRFWSSYPFSVVVYAGSGASAARAVLLSPLHPIRLAWLAGAEAALRGSKHSGLLAGILEGWNLPAVGPQSNSGNGRMIAIPIDAGPDQLFLGWSMLVNVSVAGTQSLEAPSRIGAIQAPGVSVTGLNADGVRAALRTFQRMNPHVSTLSLDLSASLPTARLQEIDDAIVGVVTAAASDDGVRGGVRVFDSLNRLGDPPLGVLEQRPDADAGRPVRWSRYKSDSGSGPRSNLRFLQDAGIKVEVTKTDVRGSGVLGSVPLRRVTAPPEVQSSVDMAVSYPVVEAELGQSSFQAALAEIEQASEGVAIGVEMFKAALVNSRADWTVTGESWLGASALADLLASSGAGQMLWEWRPPYLGSRSAPRLDARPFVSVVKVSPAFVSQVSSNVSKALGADALEDVSHSVHQVLNTLGTRGIGLSTLMAQGATHAAGAIGFYLTLRLTDAAPVNGWDLLVLPIDACDDFLRALADETAGPNQLQRADLLVLAVRGTELVMVPIEIKSYGLDSQEHCNLPSTSASLAEPLAQLEATNALLRQVIAQSAVAESSEGLDAALWRHGLAAMLEAALRLRPAREGVSVGSRKLLQAVLNGTASLRLGRSLICFFGHNAFTSAGDQYVPLRDLEAVSRDPNSPKSGALVANTQVAMKEASQGSGPLVDEWEKLLKWAIASIDESSPGERVKSVARSTQFEAEDSSSLSTDPPSQASVADSSRPERHDDESHGSVPRKAERPWAESQSSEIVDDGVRFSLGKALGGFVSDDIEYWPSNTALNQLNIGVVGDLGTGKTQFLRALIRQIRRGAAHNQPSPVSMLAFDYKRDYQDDRFLSDVGGLLLRPFHIPLDVLAINGVYTPQKAVQAGGSFIDVLAKIYKGIGPVQRNNLLVTIKDLFQESGGVSPTIGQIHSAYEAAYGSDAVSSVLNGFVLNEVFSEDRTELRTMNELLDDRVLVLAINELGTDERLKVALITLFLNKYYEYMLGLTKWPYQGAAPQLRRLNSFVLVDEATNIMQHEFPVLEQLLLQGREFGVGVILASQYVSHFKVGSINYGEALLTKVVHKVPAVTLKELRAFGYGSANQGQVDMLPNLAVHEALCRTLGVEGRFIRGTPYFELVEADRRNEDTAAT